MLNKSTGNMYEFITHTWNTIKGACPHDCSYCYMKRFGKQNPVRFDEKELKTDLGTGNFIFVGSSCDMFAECLSIDWLVKTLYYCSKFNNKYLFQTKNPKHINAAYLPENSVICTTIESNIFYPDIMKNSPSPNNRSYYLGNLSDIVGTYITIEPIMDFDLPKFVKMIKECSPIQINIGSDSGHNNLPEPPKEKILELISELEKFTVVHQKSNLKRLLK